MKNFEQNALDMLENEIVKSLFGYTDATMTNQSITWESLENAWNLLKFPKYEIWLSDHVPTDEIYKIDCGHFRKEAEERYRRSNEEMLIRLSNKLSPFTLDILSQCMELPAFSSFLPGTDFILIMNEEGYRLNENDLAGIPVFKSGNRIK